MATHWNVADSRFLWDDMHEVVEPTPEPANTVGTGTSPRCTVGGVTVWSPTVCSRVRD